MTDREMASHLVGLWLAGMLIGSISCETKCYKAESLGDAEGNVYYCYGDTPDCCEKDSEFTCCETNASKNWKEQAQLWGTVAGVVILIGVVFFCCKNDNTCCNDDRTLAERFGLKRKTEPKLTDISLPVPGYVSQPRNRNSLIGNLPPLPPMTSYPESRKYGRLEGGSPSLDKQSGRYNSGYIDDDDYHY